MHELGIVSEVVDMVCERSDGARVERIVLEIGQLSLVLPDAVRFCFDLVARGTACEGAVLEIIETPGRGRCRQCKKELALGDLLEACPCGHVDVEVLAGQELRVKEMDVV